MWRRQRDRGSTTIETAIIMPAAAAMFIVSIGAGRVNLALQAADSAAYDAARSASIARTEAAAGTQARNAATAAFVDQGIRCSPLTVTPNLAGFRKPVGQPAVVSVEVTCRLDLSDILDLPRFDIPDFITLESSFISPLDTYRGRT